MAAKSLRGARNRSRPLIGNTVPEGNADGLGRVVLQYLPGVGGSFIDRLLGRIVIQHGGTCLPNGGLGRWRNRSNYRMWGVNDKWPLGRVKGIGAKKAPVLPAGRDIEAKKAPALPAGDDIECKSPRIACGDGRCVANFDFVFNQYGLHFPQIRGRLKMW